MIPTGSFALLPDRESAGAALRTMHESLAPAAASSSTSNRPRWRRPPAG
ncbi:hypothetical protein ACIHEI_36900 [Kitasatospora sp. NPDC051984]